MSQGNSEFTGIQIYEDADGTRQVNFFQDGMITPLEPNEQDMERPLGFYDVDMNPVPDPTSDEAKVDAAIARMDSLQSRLGGLQKRR